MNLNGPDSLYVWVNQHSILWEKIPEEYWVPNLQFLDEVAFRLWRTKSPIFNLHVETWRGVTGKAALRTIIEAHQSTGVLTQTSGYEVGKHARTYAWQEPLPHDYCALLLEGTAAQTRHRKRRYRHLASLTPAMEAQVDCWERITVEDEALKAGGLGAYGLFQVGYGQEWAKNGDDGRLYSSYTSLQRVQRKHLRIDGDEIAEVDIRHSDFFWLLLHCYELQQVDQQFADDVMTGTLYERAYAENRESIDSAPRMYREPEWSKPPERVKTQVLSLLNDPQPTHLRRELQEWFCRVYPRTGAILISHLQNHRGFWPVARKWETTVMLPFSASLAECGIANFTIHDCVAGKASQIEEIEGRLKEFAAKHIQSILPGCPYELPLKAVLCSEINH